MAFKSLLSRKYSFYKLIKFTKCSNDLKLYLGLSHFSNSDFSTEVTSSVPKQQKNNRFKKTKSLNEVELTDNPDIFGTFSKEFKVEKRVLLMTDEEGDVEERYFYNNRVGKTRLSTKQYADLIKGLLSEKKLTDALDILETKMIKEDRVSPENYIYNLLIDACAKYGYTKKAFQLYNQMKKRGLKVTGATYTSLFNACALSPVPGDGLERAHLLRQLITEKAVLLNQTNYHAMIKAFGHCGDLETAFCLVDEMVEKQVTISSETFSFLLQACISDKEAGFRHALLVWQKMRQRRIAPSVYCYNLMLRCVRDCGIGEVKDASLFLSDGKQKKDRNDLVAGGGDSVVSDLDGSKADELSAVGPAMIPNLLAQRPHLGTIVAIRSMDRPKYRLMLIGGSSGFLEQMEQDNVKPDIKTVTQLLHVIPSTSIAEHELLDLLERSSVSIDIDFCNMLIKKRCMRHDFCGAKDVLVLMRGNRLVPNLMTFGVLSLACRSNEEAYQLLEDVEKAGFRVNIEILGGLLCSARHTWNVNLVIRLMEIVTEERIQPSRKFVQQLDKFRDFVLKQMELKSEGKPYHSKVDCGNFISSFDKFQMRYNMWLKFIEIDNSDSIHPWKQFKRKENMHN